MSGQNNGKDDKSLLINHLKQLFQAAASLRYNVLALLDMQLYVQAHS